MITTTNLFVLVLLLGVAIYTASFGVWTWRKKNKLGAVMVFIVALTAFFFPAYTLLFRY